MQEREAVRAGADWYVRSHEELRKRLKRHRVAVIGSGAWACAAARMIAQNTATGPNADEFHDRVRMWVYQEEVDVRPLHALRRLARAGKVNRR